MKKTKFLKIVLSGILCALFVFGACACSAFRPKDPNAGDGSDAEIRAIYDLYVENCAEEGKTPLTYDAWLASIKGEKGDKGDPGTPGTNGKDGNGWLFGDTVPTSSLGKVGDLYLNHATWDVYTKETTGWTLRGNIKGAKGDPGTSSTKPTLPEGTEEYYEPITATSGTELLGQLHDLITTTHTRYTSYSDCRDYATVTDPALNEESGIVEFYTHETITTYIGTSNAAGTWNREHVWPQSLSKDSSGRQLWGKEGGGADLHHIRPSEKEMNGTRGNDKFGEVTNGGAVYSKTTSGANSQIGGHHADGVFEPLDNVKGDVARIVLYVYIHYNSYENVHGTTNGNGSSRFFSTLPITNIIAASSEEAAFALLLKWNSADPVDAIETKRNEEVFKIQGNRNPFIDYAQWADDIWGE